MPISVPVYTQKVGTSSLPIPQFSGNDPVSAALDRVGQGVSDLGRTAAPIIKGIKDEHDDAAVQDAYTKLVSLKQSLLDDPQNGLTNLKGQDALQESDSFVKSFKVDSEDIRSKLTTDEQRSMFDKLLFQQTVSFHDTVNRHVAAQSDILADQSFQTALEASKSDAVGAAQRGEIDKAAEAIGTGLGAIDRRAHRMGWSPDVAEMQRKRFATESHLGVLDSMLERGRTAEARAYLDNIKKDGHLDNDLLGKSNIEKVIRTASEAEVGAQMARKFVGGSATTVVRPWDPTPIERPNASKALAELAKVDADPNVSEAVKQSVRERTESMLRASDQSWRGALDSVYSRAITKLEQNGWNLSALSQEKTFLLSKDVEGGSVWEAIVGRRDQELHRRAGAAATPSQHEAMVRFLLTLPERQNEYMDPANANAFMREWGQQLASSDLEQAAGYVARAGVSAAKPDPTLTAPVISRIKQAGNEAGLWGAKGPKTEDDNRRYLEVYNDLLTKQADLKRQGKQLDDAAVQETMKAWATKGTVKGSGLIWDDSGVSRVEAMTNPSYQGKPFVEDIPADAQKQIDVALSAHGNPVTDEFRRWLWNKSKGIPDAQNPRPTDPKPPRPGESSTWGYPQPGTSQ